MAALNITEFNKKNCEGIDPLDVNAYFNLAYDPECDTCLILETSWGDTGIDLLPQIQHGETDTHLFLAPTTSDETRDWEYLQYNSENYLTGLNGRGPDCIYGDDLSRIISMKYLKDVDQETYPVDGDIYMYDGEHNLFYTFNLQNYMDTTDARLDSLEYRMDVAEQNIRDIYEILESIWKSIRAIEQEITSIKNDIAEMQDDIADMQNDISNIQNDISDIQGDITNIQSDISNIQGDVSNNSNRISVLEALLTPPSGAPSNVAICWGNINLYSDYTNSSNRNWGLYTHSLNSTIANDEYFS